MPDMRYFNAKEKFLGYAFEVFEHYFDSYDGFEQQFETIKKDEEKNLFLKISSFYKFLIHDGKFVIKKDGTEKFIDYIDDTYKFIAIMSFIEALYSDEKYIDFFQWLSSRERRSKVFPISKHRDLEKLYIDYKKEYGAAQKAKRFFSSLDAKAQNYITARITVGGGYKPVEMLAKLLYDIRSEFVHNARLILEFIKGGMISHRGGKEIWSSIQFNDISVLFEEGLLQYFGFSPDNRKL